MAVSCATNFVRAVRPQRLTVSADTSHKGRSTSVAHCAIVDERGRPSPRSRCSSWGRSRASASCAERLRLPAEAS
ncbi:MAG: hotdog domain-containing protein [Eggerthellaceae bacterium]